MILKNADFIKKYGKFEFLQISKVIPQYLLLANIKKDIGGYKINNTKKNVKIYRKEDKSNIYLDFATIFSVGYKNLKQYIESQVVKVNEES